MKKISYLLYSILIIGLLTGCSVSLAADVTPPPNLAPQQQPAVEEPVEVSVVLPMIEPDIKNGAQIYSEKCAPCHGPTGMGDGTQSDQLPNPVTPIGDFSIAKVSRPIDWYKTITVGNIEKFMPGFQSLNDRERWDVTAYVMTLSLSEDLVNVGEIVFNQNCTECHTSDNLPLENASEMAEFSITDIQQIVFEGVSPEMPAFADVLVEEETVAVSSYVRYLGFDSSSRPVADVENQDSESLDTENIEIQTEDFATFNILGNIINAASAPAGLEVMLTGYDGMEIVIQETSLVNEDGSFEFQDLENVTGRVYQAGVIIDGMQHTSEVVHNPELDSSGNFELSIEIKKTSTDSSVLFAERMHVFFDFLAEDVIQIVEMYVIQNPSDAIVVPKDSSTPILSFKIPADAQNLQFEQGILGQDYLPLDDGFGVMSSFGANSSIQLLFAYELPYPKSLDLDLYLPLPVNASIFMLPSNQIKFSSEQLAFSGERDIQGMQIQTYSGEAMQAESSIKVNLTGKVKQSTQIVQEGNTNSIFIGAAGLVFALGIAFYFLRKRKINNLEEEEISEFEEEDVDSLLDAVIALDDAFQSGEIPEQAYVNRRNELTKKIKSLQSSEG